MTVSYQYDVASSTSGGFTRLLFKWQGSLYKLIYNELILFCCAYGLMAAIYRYVFNQNQKRVFEQVAFYCDTYMNYIPLSFILGFYVSFVASRWWQQYMAIPWPDKILHAIALYVSGNDEKGRILRRSLVRYLNLSLVMVLRSISSAVKKRFPTVEHLVEAGFISSEELNIFNMVPNKEFNTYWIPCTWFTALVKEARAQKRISDPVGLKLIMEEFCEFRQKCGMLWSYDWVSIPLVYTQVVTIATYSFFIAAVVGRQFVEKSPIPYKKMIDLYVPFFTMLQFFFYMGLLKVAEQLINPFGDDDEDFELNWIIDRHMKVSYLIVDTLIARAPPLTKDIFFNEESPELPYTEASAGFKKKTYRGSVANMVIPEEKQNLILPDIIEEGEESDDDLKYLKSHLKQSHLSLRFNDMHSSSNASEAPQDGRSLSVPEMQRYPLSPSSSVSSRASSFRSVGHSKHQSRRFGTAGSKGVSSALIVLGSNQAIMGADSSHVEKSHFDLTEDDEGAPQKKDSLKSRPDEDMDYLFFPFRDVCLDIEDPNFDSSTDSFKKFKEKGLQWMASSIQAKLAMKKKPVIKWRPYHKPLQIPEEYINKNSLSFEDAVPPGVFEDECAFMWRTIDEETLSYKAANSNPALNEDFKVLVSSPTIDRKILSYYNEIKPRSLSRDTEDTISTSRVNISNTTNSPALKTSKAKRTRYKFKGRTKPKLQKSRFNSMPYLPNSKCGQKAIISRLLKSLSESSVFMETVTNKIEDLHESHLHKSRNTDYRIPSIPKKRREPLSVRQRSNDYRPNFQKKTS